MSVANKPWPGGTVSPSVVVHPSGRQPGSASVSPHFAQGVGPPPVPSIGVLSNAVLFQVVPSFFTMSLLVTCD